MHSISCLSIDGQGLREEVSLVCPENRFAFGSSHSTTNAATASLSSTLPVRSVPRLSCAGRSPGVFFVLRKAKASEKERPGKIHCGHQRQGIRAEWWNAYRDN